MARGHTSDTKWKQVRPSVMSTGGGSIGTLSQATLSDILAIVAGNRFNTGSQHSGSTTSRVRLSMPNRLVTLSGSGRSSTAPRSMISRNSMMRALYSKQADAKEFAAMTAAMNPRLARTAIMDHRMNINGLPSYRYVMALDPSQPQYQKARQYVQLTGLMDSRGSDLGMRGIFSSLLQSTDPTVQNLLRIDAIDGAFGDMAKRLALAPGGFQLMKKMGPLVMRLLS